MSVETKLDRLQELLPRLMRFVSVLSGSAELQGLNKEAFVAYLCETAENPAPHALPDISAQFFSDVYAYWLSQVEQGKIQPVILKQEDSVYQPGIFADENNRLILETGAFLVGLSPSQRAALLLASGEGFSYETSAQILRIPVEKLRLEIAQAKGKLAGERYSASRGLLKNQGVNQGVIPETSTMKLTGT